MRILAGAIITIFWTFVPSAVSAQAVNSAALSATTAAVQAAGQEAVSPASPLFREAFSSKALSDALTGIEQGQAVSQERREMPRRMERRSWWSRNWKWFVPVVAAGAAAGGYACYKHCVNENVNHQVVIINY